MSNLNVFNFDNQQVRTVVKEGEPWFVAADVAAVLDYNEAKDMTRNIDEDEKDRQIVPTRGGEQEMLVINESGLYSAILRSRKPEAKRFKKWVTSEVLPSIRKTGSFAVKPTATNNQLPSTKEALEVAEILTRVLKLEGSAAMSVYRKAVQITTPTLLDLVPAYAIDAPEGSAITSSSEVTKSATELLKEVGCSVNVRKFNDMLVEQGYLETKTRPTSNGGTKQFKNITTKGLKYGKNLTSDKNQKETQPHWYVNKFQQLLADIGL